MKKATTDKNKDKISCEILILTYGAMVQQIIKDSESMLDANKKIEQLGYNIGLRLIDDFLAKYTVKPCRNYKEIVESISKVAFDVYLGVKCEITNYQETQEAGCSFILGLKENPLNDYVELTEDQQALEYSNLICGVLRGALQMVLIQWKIQIDTQCKMVKDPLKGDSKTEIQVQMQKIKLEDE